MVRAASSRILPADAMSGGIPFLFALSLTVSALHSSAASRRRLAATCSRKAAAADDNRQWRGSGCRCRSAGRWWLSEGLELWESGKA